MNLHPADEQVDAESFVRECRRDARMFPRPHIDEVVRHQVRRIVSKDFISGCCDAGNCSVEE